MKEMPWSIWKTLEWATGTCLSECHLLLIGHRFPRQPHSSHWKWQTTVVLLRRQTEIIKGSKWNPKDQWEELKSSLGNACEHVSPTWIRVHQMKFRHQPFHTSLLLLSPLSFWNLEMPPEEHARALSFYTLNVCLLLNWCRKPKCLKSSKGNVDCGKQSLQSRKAGTCGQ